MTQTKYSEKGVSYCGAIKYRGGKKDQNQTELRRALVADYNISLSILSISCQNIPSRIYGRLSLSFSIIIVCRIKWFGKVYNHTLSYIKMTVVIFLDYN